MALSRTLTLSADGVERVIARFGIGRLPLVLRDSAVWRDAGDEDERERVAISEFGAHGLLERNGSIDRDFEDSLWALCQPTVAYFGWMSFQDAERQVFACVRGREALVATRENDHITLEQSQPDDLAHALVDRLPKSDPARFQPILLPEEKPGGGQESGRVMERVDTRPRGTDMQTLQRLMDAERYGGAELYVAVRDSVGRTKQSHDSLGYTITEFGAFFNRLQPTTAGGQRIFLAPAPLSEIARHLQQMRAELV